MGDWHKVTKRIEGKLYDFWQRSTITGRRVTTESEYIGASTSSDGEDQPACDLPDEPEQAAMIKRERIEPSKK